MISRATLTAAVIFAVGAAIGPGRAAYAQDIDLPFRKFVLPNGLRLIVHEDHKAPIVAVNVWYHVGSKNERPGRTGLAHLFEHLMFSGSENFNDLFVKPFFANGATDMNGTTNFDRTNYFANVPVGALDLALWLESDRMGHLLGVVDQARLDTQRGVVQNEKRQNDNQPFGAVLRAIHENAYPNGHPYSWPVSGSLEDLDAATLVDAHQWFKTYYGAANAVVVIAGDVDAKVVEQKVQAYFGDIPSGPPLQKHTKWVAKRTETRRIRLQDRVAAGRLYRAWNIPEWGNADTEYLGLVLRLMTSGKTSRLYRRLISQDQTASEVSGQILDRELGGLFICWATSTAGTSTQAIDNAMAEELARFVEHGPTPSELQRVKAEFEATFIRGIERIGGFGGKSDVLAQYEVFGDDPGLYRRTLQRVRSATAQDLQDAARRWLSTGDLIVEAQAIPRQASTAASTIDRTRLPAVDAPPPAPFPELRRGRLANGLELVVARRPGVPVIDFSLVVGAGYAADADAKPGTTMLALDMLDEGAGARSSSEVSESLARLGAVLSTTSDLDFSYVNMSVLKSNLAPSLSIFADILLRPTFEETELARLKSEQLARIQREKAAPSQLVLRVLPKLLYGGAHAYALPLTGSGSSQSVELLTAADLRAFYDRRFVPNNATLVIVGDTSLEEIQPQLEPLLGGWQPRAVPTTTIAPVPKAARPTVYVIDRPGAIQSVVVAAQLLPGKRHEQETAFEVVNEVLGAGFSGRINMNLREDKRWSYGANSLVVEARAQRPFFVLAPVQTDKTIETIGEIKRELTDISGAKPPTADEVARGKNARTLTLPGRWETNAAVGAAIIDTIRFQLPANYWNEYTQHVRALDLVEVRRAAAGLITPSAMTWLIIGDRRQFADRLRELDLGELRFLDADGNPDVRPPQE